LFYIISKLKYNIIFLNHFSQKLNINKHFKMILIIIKDSIHVKHYFSISKPLEESLDDLLNIYEIAKILTMEFHTLHHDEIWSLFYLVNEKFNFPKFKESLFNSSEFHKKMILELYDLLTCRGEIVNLEDVRQIN
jgi:hypothetical protein